ncbi:hypothetical protein LCGC14_3087220, partial [marine sediment metagenome]
YASNSFLALKISFANELANVVDHFNLTQPFTKVNVDDITEIMGMDHRISPAFFRSGVGYGGSCFPKDIKALSHFARELKSPMHLLEKTTEVNAYQPIKAIEHLIDVIGDLTNRDVGIFGLSFKPHTEDIREAPAKTIINELLSPHANVHCWDPKAEPSMAIEFPSLCYHHTIPDTFEHADSAIIVTDWPELKDYFVNYKPTIPIIDGRGVYPEADRSIGRTKVKDFVKLQNIR